MELQEQFYSDWRSSTNKVFWGLTLALILTFFANVFDMISWVPIAGEMIWEHSQTGTASLWDSKVFRFGVGIKVIIVLGYVMYFIGLSDFAKTRQTENAAHYIYKVRTGSIIILITAIVNVFFGFIAIIPIIGQFFMFIMWLMAVIAFFIMKSGYDGMMNCDEFSGIAKLGAKNVRYACVCILRLLFSPIVIAIVGFIGAALFGGSLYGMREDMSFEGLKQMFFGGAALLAVVAAIAVICMICWAICAFIWPMMGWNRIKNGGPADTLFIVETEENFNTQEETAQAIETTNPTQERNTELVIKEENSQQNKQIEKAEPEVTDYDGVKGDSESKDNRTLLYSIGGIITVAIIGIICFFAFGKGKKSESILGLQKPKWEKFVHMKGKETAFYQSPNLSSPKLMQACNAEGCGIDYQYLWTGEKPSEGYTDFENYKYTDETSVFPVIEEQDGWYKVYLSTKDKIHEAYVEKSQCEEVSPEPITQEVLSKISSDYYLLEQGKYKNLCFALGSNDIDEPELCMGELIDEKCIAFSAHYDMFILENDTTQNFTFSRGEYISDDGATNYTFSIFFNPNRSISTGDYKHFNTKSLTEEEISNMVEKTTSVKHDNGLLRYAYYFPSVSGNSLFYFYPYKEFEGEENMEEGTTTKHISNYRVEDDENLIATVDGEDREVDLDIGKTILFGVKDLDGDGNMEAIASHYMSGINGAAVDCPFIVYYDPESDTFKKTEEMKITIDTEPTIEEDGGKPIIIQRDGLRTVRYIFENKKLKVLDDKTKKYGHIETKIDLADLFGDEEGEKTQSVVFPNGEEATLHFEYENGGMYHGGKMTLENIELANGEKIYVGEAAKTFYILKETTNDMPEIIGDTHLYRWNGENYVEE